MVICQILGVPLKDEPKFHAWIHDFMAGLMDGGPDKATPAGQLRAETGIAAKNALAQYLVELIQGFVKQPGDSMLSKMVNDASGPDGLMTVREAATNGTLLLTAGHDSTVNTITHCILTVLRNPGTFELLRSRRELIPGAIEEVLRLESAVQFFPVRSATADIEIGGTVIPQGSTVHLIYAAANRDPSKFPNPNTFDPERRNNEHMGWGSGVHTCFGGPLARLARFADLNDQVEACNRVFASDTRWTVVRGSDLEEGESQGLPVWSRHVGDPILESNLTRRVDFALFMVEALENNELIHEAPAIVGRQTPSALAHAASD